MRGTLVLMGCLLAATAARPAHTQTTTGDLAGTVTDETGGALPAVTVGLTGAHVPSRPTVSTDDHGRYRFPALPPSIYAVTFTAPGFLTLHHRGVRVQLGASQQLDVTMQRQGLAEEVTVTGEGPLVDTRSNKVGAHYDQDWVRNAPGRRVTFFDLVYAAPGVNQETSTSGRSTALGSNSNENVYLLDGTDFTAPSTGASWPWPNVDAVGEVEVVTLGAPAEYGNLQGAVFNVITRQGTNTFHGDANFYYQHQGLTGRNTGDDEDGGLPYQRDAYRDLTLQLSGPVLKDKLWFFASYQYQRDRASPSGTDPRFPELFEEDRVFAKLNWQIDARNRLMLAYHDEAYRLSFPAVNVAASAVDVGYGRVPTPNLTFTSTISDRTVLEARYSGFYGDEHIDPLDGGPRIAPRFYDFDSGQVSGGIYGWHDAEIWKTSLSGKISHFADDFLGSGHDFRFGVQYYEGGREGVQAYNDYVYTYRAADGEQQGYGYTQLPFRYGGEVVAVGVHADDSFQVGSRLTVNAGLRSDHSRALYRSYPILDASANETGRSTPGNNNLFSWDSVSPRIGLVWKATADGRSVLRGHYGRYHRGVVTSEFVEAVPSISPLFIGTWDFAAGALQPESLVAVNPEVRRVDPGYRGSHTDQFLLGFEREVFPDFAVALTGTHKRGTGYGGWRDITGQYEPVVYRDDQGQDATGRPIQVWRLVGDPSAREFLLTNPEGLFTRFTGIVLQATKRMARGWQLSSSLTVGSAKGRIGSSTRPPGTSQTGVADRFGQNPNDFVNTDGALIGDRTTTFKSQLLVELPKGTLVAASYTWQSGRPWARKVRVEDLGLFTTILAERIDGGRLLPSQNLLDLRVQKQMRLAGRTRLAFFADVLNAFNDDAYEWVESQIGTAPNFGRPAGFIAPRRMVVGAKVSF